MKMWMLMDSCSLKWKAAICKVFDTIESKVKHIKIDIH